MLFLWVLGFNLRLTLESDDNKISVLQQSRLACLISQAHQYIILLFIIKKIF